MHKMGESMKYLLALDQGTTSSRAIVFDSDGRVCGVGQREFPQYFPRPGWVDHDPEEIWEAQIATVRAAIDSAGISSSDVAAIGIANQRETTVLWERRTGRPLAPAIVWQDRRTAEHCDRLRADGYAETIQATTGLVLDAYFSGTKLSWLLDHVPDARSRAAAGELCFGTIDSWLLFKLTGGAVHATDPSNASRTMLFDIHAGKWSEELCGILNVPVEVLPEVRTSSEIYGEATVDPLRGTPIAGIAGDQQAALFGQHCFDRGLAKNTYGTGCFLLVNTGSEAVASRNQLLTTIAWQRGERTEYALEGSVFAGGAVVQWLRDGLGMIQDAAEVESLAASVDSSEGVVLVPAFAGLGAPHWDPYARGALFGMTRGTGRAHIARAALESIALQVRDLVAAMEQDAGFRLRELRVDGGASANDFLMQLQADLLGIPVVRPEETESTAQGAAYLAGLAVGVWDSTGALAATAGEERVFEPDGDADTEALIERWGRAIERAKRWEEPTPVS